MSWLIWSPPQDRHYDDDPSSSDINVINVKRYLMEHGPEVAHCLARLEVDDDSWVVAWSVGKHLEKKGWQDLQWGKTIYYFYTLQNWW